MGQNWRAPADLVGFVALAYLISCPVDLAWRFACGATPLPGRSAADAGWSRPCRGGVGRALENARQSALEGPFTGLAFAPLPRWIVGALVFVPVFVSLEEIGWRGYALPRLQAHFEALTASLLLGLLHGVWHLPLYWIPESGMGALTLQGFLLFLAGLLPGTVVLTWIFNSTGGGLVPVIVAHGSYNLFVSGVVPPEQYRAHYDGMTALVGAVFAAGLVWRAGAAHLCRGNRIPTAGLRW